MKFAQIAAIALFVATPFAASAQQADPFVATAGPELLPLLIIGGAATVIAIASASGTK